MDPFPNLLAALTLELGTAQMAAAEAASGLPASAASALVTLGPYPGTSIGELARIAGVSHSVMVRIADQLVARGLVSRAAGTDRRQVSLTLTAAGTALRARILAARAEAVGPALAAVPPDGRAALAAAVARMLDALTVSRQAGDHICRLCDEDACGSGCPVDARQRRFDSVSPHA